MKFARSLPVQLCGVIAAVLLFGSWLDTTTIRVFYTFSTWFKEVLSCALPLIVFSFVLNGILSFKKNAPVVLTIMLSCIFFSNMVISFFAYGAINLFSSIISCNGAAGAVAVNDAIQPLYTLTLPRLISSELALLLAIGLGLLLSFVRIRSLDAIIIASKKWIEKVLHIVLIPALPVYVLGFLLKMQHEGLFSQLIAHYGTIVLFIFALQMVYLMWIYLLAACFNIADAARYIRNALPSYLTAFGSMSSTATVPVSIAAAEKNMGHRSLADMAMPIMANVHLVGDSISTPILAMTTMVLFKGCMAGIAQYATFVFYFCTAMFAVSAIPGGGIIIMIPILVSQLDFTPEMVSVITALYLLFDAFSTAANVMGDGALVIIVYKVLRRLRIIT